MTNDKLIRQAASVVRSRKTEGGLFADVGCALLSTEGTVYLGVCATSGLSGFCAEQTAIGSMITDGNYGIAKIVAVWKDEDETVHVISPCRNCRQMMLEMHEGNLGAEVILDRDESVTLAELSTHSDWWKKSL